MTKETFIGNVRRMLSPELVELSDPSYPLRNTCYVVRDNSTPSLKFTVPGVRLGLKAWRMNAADAVLKYNEREHLYRCKIKRWFNEAVSS